MPVYVLPGKISIMFTFTRSHLMLIAVMSMCSNLNAAAMVQLHVSPEGGDDNTGALDAPVATLEKARDLLREIRRTDQEAFSGGATIWIHNGVFEQSLPLILSNEDGGGKENPVFYRAAPGESPELIGGRILPPEAFEPVMDASVLDRIDSEARKEVRFLDLYGMGIQDLGEFPDSYNTPPALPELFFKGERMTLARWPNGEEWATVAGVVDSGPAPWRNHSSQDTGTFEYSGERPLRWISAPAVWLYGYWCFDWASETIRVKSIDTTQHRITLLKPHVYGIGSGNQAERRFCALNLLEELDTPGEYYIDREQGRLYFWPPTPITNGDIILSLMKEPVIQIRDASHLCLQDITVTCCAGPAILVEGGEEVAVRSCNVRNTGLDGIIVQGGNKHLVEACDISETGTGGLLIGGGDRKTLAPCNHEAVNNDIWNVGRRKRTHAYNVHISGVGVRLAHNRIHHAPHQAIGLGGNDHVIEFNEIYDICQESDDCGAFYMGRNPSERGSILRYNFWRDTGGPRSHGSCAVYFDDGSGGQTVYGNVFLRAAGGNFGAVFVHGGHNNRVYNNIFVDCKAAMRQVRWNDDRWREWVHGDLWKQWLTQDVDITQPPYTERYPELKGFFEFNGEKRTNYAERNVAVRCPMLLDGDWEEKDNFVTDTDPGFVDAATMNFQLREDSVVFQKIPGFERIPFDKIGPQRESSPLR